MHNIFVRLRKKSTIPHTVICSLNAQDMFLEDKALNKIILAHNM